MTANEKYTLMSIGIFDKLTFEEMEILGSKVSSYQFKEGEVLFHEGAHGDSMYFVVDGVLEIAKQSEEGKQFVIANISKGQSVGEMAIIEGIVRSATVRAKTEGSLLALRRGDFDALLEEHPKIGVKILKSVSCLLSMNLRKTSLELIKLMLQNF